MKTVFRLLRQVSIEKLDDWAEGVEKVLEMLKLISGGSELAYEKRAAGEKAYKDMGARFIVYGHTHEFKVYPLRSVHQRPKVFNQYYINSGTWHPWHESGKDEGEHKGFLSHKTMTYLGFYQGDERRGHAYETWNGTLEL
jgi:UDP-2,3-diacylglucosamine pyrophosphatase LpxH